ncbi:hypothetical protein BN1723_015528 [Verticillium longisporum]|uniref:Uncharacterized protein n=1 Tax=Verticillium longisporum TaxID=100787 RepID=A0A0G4MZP5_VERLO|nr:hypothetical protein BN1723_015528 [Verticillium longisporum]
MSLVKGDTPRWVSQLHSPPASKQKVNGISDPNGYPSSQSSGSKKQKDVKHTPRKQPTPAEMDTLKAM